MYAAISDKAAEEWIGLMGEYIYLVGLGVVAVIVVIVGIVLRPKKDKAKGGKNKRGKGKGGKDKFYKPDAYNDTGGDGDDFQDSNLYDMKEGKGGTGFVDDDYDPKKEKGKEKLESWDDY